MHGPMNVKFVWSLVVLLSICHQAFLVWEQKIGRGSHIQWMGSCL